MMPSDLKKVISPSHVFAVYPVKIDGITLCVLSAQKWTCAVTFFLLWLCRAALLFSHLHNLKRWESRQHCLLLSAFIEPIHRRVSNLFSDPMPKCPSHHIFSTEYYHFCFRMSDRESLTVFSQSFHFLETPRGHLLSYCCRMYRYVLL